MRDIREIIKETVGTFKNEDKCPACNGIGYELDVCPHCQRKGTLSVPLGMVDKGVAYCKGCGQSVEGINKGEYPECLECHGSGKKINTTSNSHMETHVDQPQERSDMFERLSPNQLNALLETLMRNPKQFGQMYTVLANDGFVPLNEGADYATKRKVFSEMIKDGQLAKQMLQTLVETNQIQVEATDFYAKDQQAKADIGNKPVYNPDSKARILRDKPRGEYGNYIHKLSQIPPEDSNYTGEITPDDLARQNSDFEKYGRETPVGARRNKPVETIPTDNGGEDGEGGAPASPIAAVNPEEDNTEVTDGSPEAITQSADDEILSQVKGLGAAKNEKLSVEAQMQKNKQELAGFAEMAGFTKPDGTGDFNAYSSYLVKNYDNLPPNEKEVADWFKGLLAQQKQLTQNMHSLQTKVAPPVVAPEFSSELEPAIGEAKNLQLRKGTGDSELQLRAGTKGKIFEARLRKLEPYKKVAVLEFLENDPKMLDDQDYADMATMTGICEGDLVAMRIEYEDSINEITYPIIGGQDVHGQNKKNETKELNREVKNAAKTQETTEEKVRDFKIKKFEGEDAKDQVAKNGGQDQNRGMGGLVDVLNQETGDKNKQKYVDQANGVYGKRDPKSVKNDANVGDGMAGEGKPTDVGSELLKKGEKQPDYYQTTENEREDTIPGKPRIRDEKPKQVQLSSVNEDIDRMKGLFSYNTNTYANTKPSNNPNVVFEQQLGTFRVMTESVDRSDRPTPQQLLAMSTVIYEGEETKFDGKNHFNAKGDTVDKPEKEEGEEKSTGDSFKDHQFKPKGETDAKKKGFDVGSLDEGKDTGKVCTECSHKIWEKEGKEKCQCNGEPKAEKDDLLERQLERQKKLAGVKTEAKHQQLKHTKGHQIETGTEVVVDEAKNLQLKHTKGHQIEAGTKKEDDKD